MTKLHCDALAAEIKCKAQDLLEQRSSNDGKMKKEILEIIAQELGCPNHNTLKKYMKDPFALLQKELKKEGFHGLWFNQYKEALGYLHQQGGYLLPYEKRYFICKDDYIQSMGLSPHDEDWKKIKYNWVYPGDFKAHWRLFEQLMRRKAGLV